MPLQNRVLATSDIVADPARGLFMGNRGILHDPAQKLGRARWKHKAWIICVLEHKGWHRAVMSPGAYTELFFLDEAVALAAGHRPCKLCRRTAYLNYTAALRHTGSAPDLDRVLHAERAVPRRFEQRRHVADISQLPDGAIIFDGVPKLVLGDALLPIAPGGYCARERRPRTGTALLLTPPSSVAALSGGYGPVLHRTAAAELGH